MPSHEERAREIVERNPSRAGFIAVQRKGEKLGPDEERAMRQREAEEA